MHKEKHFQVNIGSSSILLIFVILCLISFAILSLVSANADLKLSNKVLTRTTAYYEACNQAEISLANIDQTLFHLYETTQSEEEYYSKAGGQTISYTYPISDLQSLSLSLEVLYPSSSQGTFYNVTEWKVITTGTLDYDEDLNLFTDPNTLTE